MRADHELVLAFLRAAGISDQRVQDVTITASAAGVTTVVVTHTVETHHAVLLPKEPPYPELPRVTRRIQTTYLLDEFVDDGTTQHIGGTP